MSIFADTPTHQPYDFQVKIYNATASNFPIEGRVSKIVVQSGIQDIKGIVTGNKIGDGMSGVFYGANAYKGTIEFQMSDYKGDFGNTCTIHFDSLAQNYSPQTCIIDDMTQKKVVIYSMSGLEQYGDGMLPTEYFFFTRG